MSVQAAKDIVGVVAAVIGILVLAAFGITEALVRLGFALGVHDCDHAFPWGQVIVGLALVVPFTLGTDAARELAKGVANRLGGGV